MATNCRGRDCNRDDCTTCQPIREHYARLHETPEGTLQELLTLPAPDAIALLLRLRTEHQEGQHP